MTHMELPLVFFTVLAQAAIGLVCLNVVSGSVVAEGKHGRFFNEQIMALALLGIGLLASLAHLGHPFEAYRTLNGLGESWLSREILAFLLLSGLMAVAAVLSLRGQPNPLLWKLTALVGVLAIGVQGMAYTPPSQPALGTSLPLVLFLITSVTLGAAFGSWFAPENRQRLLAGILAATLILGLVLSLLLPGLWLSGGLVEQATGHAYLESSLYWGRIAVGFIVPLLVLLRSRTIPSWLPWLIMAGELGGRIAFFSLTAGSASFIGMPM